MPAGRGENNTAAPRQTFRPPWVKDGGPTQSTPVQAAPWTLANRKTSDAGSTANTNNTTSDTSTDSPKAPPGPPRKTSKVTIVPVQPQQPPPQENGSAGGPKEGGGFVRPKLKPVPGKESITKNPSRDTMNKLQSREVKVPIEIARPRKVEMPLERVQRKEPPPPVEKTEPKKPELPVVQLRKVEKPVVEPPPKKKDELPFQIKLKETPKNLPKPDPEEIDTIMPAKRHDLIRQESLKNRNIPPAPPMAPPMPPPAPKMPPPDIELIMLNEKQQKKLEQLKQRPRKRPDWAQAMKEIESGKKLNHVVCNDRSKPVLSTTKAKGQFVYESEKDNVHNQLLKQIQSGVFLKRVKCNDRSKPILDGLRKFRRQLTIEEQIIKSQSMANMPEEEVMEEADEMDDIDKVRDDLQSTKQLLALELRNKEAQIRENKRLLARLQQLEAELEKEKANKTQSVEVKQDNSADEKLITTLKTEVSDARKTAEDLEKKFHDTADQLDFTKSELEEMKKQNQQLQKKLQEAGQGHGGRYTQDSRKNSTIQGPDAQNSDFEFSEEEPVSDDGEDDGSEEKVLKRQQRELKLLKNKLKNYKHKEENAKKERKVLKDIMKKSQQEIKEEKKKYRALQKEVNKMASLMKDIDEDEEEEEKEEKEEDDEEVEEEETESESESESESETSEEESSESESEEAPFEKKKDNFSNRAKRHENCLGALKKGNYMLKANAERLQDDLNKQREMTVGLQEDLDSVLSELG